MTNQDDKYAPTSWGKKKESKEPFDYETSSGQLALLKNLSMDDLILLSFENDLDFFTKAIMGTETSESVDIKNISEGMQGKDFPKLIRVVNAVVCQGVIKPRVYPVPEHEAARQKGLTYVDEIELNERMELFSVIFDTSGIEAFQEKEEDGVGSVADVADVPLPAE